MKPLDRFLVQVQGTDSPHFIFQLSWQIEGALCVNV